MRCSLILSLAVATSAVASSVLPNAARLSSNKIARRAALDCTSICDPVTNDSNACGNGNETCICTKKIASELLTCANCGVNSDPTQGIRLQNDLNEYATECQKAGASVGKLTLAKPTTTATELGISISLTTVHSSSTGLTTKSTSASPTTTTTSSTTTTITATPTTSVIVTTSTLIPLTNVPTTMSLPTPTPLIQTSVIPIVNPTDVPTPTPNSAVGGAKFSGAAALVSLLGVVVAML